MEWFLQILSLLSMASVFVITFWRVLAHSGVSLKKALPETERDANFTPDARDCARVFGYGLLFRVFVLGLSFIIYCIFVEQAETVQWPLFLENWIKWDANAYIRISEGYTSYIENGHYPTLVFFPLYSWLLKGLRLLIPSPAMAGLLLSGILSSLACMYLYKLVCLDYSRKTALLSVLLLCIFPFGFFYSAIMSESAFLLASIMTLYYIRKGNWLLGGICGFCAALSRSAGVFLVFPALVQLLEE
ncbi:MAG: glycosyltransferase family 39 protein, partial [Clostridia bacterium]|nr:glycosyltransferase family 39 protein [Clostridia bacterium]